MTPEDVPATLLATTMAAGSDVWTNLEEDEAAHILAAVIPEIQRQERERIAAEIEKAADAHDDGSSWGWGMVRAAEIARAEPEPEPTPPPAPTGTGDRHE